LEHYQGPTIEPPEGKYEPAEGKAIELKPTTA
jgi:hypothetical protein